MPAEQKCCCNGSSSEPHMHCPGWGHFNLGEEREGIERCDACAELGVGLKDDDEATQIHNLWCKCGAEAGIPAKRCHSCRTELQEQYFPKQRVQYYELEMRVLCSLCHPDARFSIRHHLSSNKEVVDVFDTHGKFIATITPAEEDFTQLKLVSKHLKAVKVEEDYPPTALISFSGR